MRKKTEHRNGLVIVLLLTAAPGLQPASGQSVPADSRQKMAAAVARQIAAASAMAPSIARQTESVERQLKTGPGFFNLPGPARSPVQMRFQPELQPECAALPPEEIDSLVNTASRREGVEPTLILSVMKEESGFRPCAVSPKGALGLMQLMPRTAANLAVKDPFNPEDNVTAGTKLLRQLLKHYDGDLALTLGAYNAGPRRVDADMAIPAIPETTNYVQRILSLLPLGQMRSLSFDSDVEH